jgi:hypothetical protein
MYLKKLLNELQADKELIDWVEDKSIEQVIESCKKGDWLLWLGYKMNLPKQELTLAKAKCAATVKHLLDNEVSFNAIDVAEKFGNQLCNRDELDKAASNAYIPDNFENFADDWTRSKYCDANNLSDFDSSVETISKLGSNYFAYQSLVVKDIISNSFLFSTINSLAAKEAAKIAAFSAANITSYSSAYAAANAIAANAAERYNSLIGNRKAYATVQAAYLYILRYRNDNERDTSNICKKIIGELLIEKINKSLTK